MGDSYLIGQLAGLAGVGKDTIRYYEKIGLLPQPPRTASGYRVYGDRELRHLRFIRKAQFLGFTLAEIGRILALRHEGAETCSAVIAIAEATLAETEQKIRDLEAFRSILNSNLSRWKQSAESGELAAAEFCGLIEYNDSVAAKK
jgi:DNA-binding transcriptional MerR regulator